MKKESDYWRNATVAVIGGGKWGTALAYLLSKNCQRVRLSVREEALARSINATRVSPAHPHLPLGPEIQALSELARVFEGGVQAVVWALPSSVCRERARAVAPFFRGDEILLHATKGIEEGSLKRISEVLREELPCPRIGVMSGPNLADEIARGEPAATVIASYFEEVVTAGQALLTSDRFRVYGANDVIGVEWAGTLKNVLAIAAGALDAMNLGANSRAMLISRGLAEMVRFGVSMGAKESTFLGLAGIGDLLATCSSPLSRNYRVGRELARGRKRADILAELGSTAEGVNTARIVWEYARTHGIQMPITEGVYQLLFDGRATEDVLKALMARPQIKDIY